MKYAVIELPDDFEKGQCHDCPLYEKYDEYCVLHSRYDECSLDVRLTNVSRETLQYGEYETPEITGKVYVTMESMTTGKPHLYIKQHKTDDKWLEITPDTDFSTCWAFSKQGAKKIIERFKSKTYKVNYDKGLVKFGTIDEYSY